MTSNFSVLLPVYRNDSPSQFKAAFESITTLQTLKPNQVVISVDGPLTMELERIVKNLESRADVKCVWSETNNGLGVALHLGLNQCDFEIVARMDSDDISYPRRFEQQIPLMTNNDLVSSGIAEFQNSTSQIDSIREGTKTGRVKGTAWFICPFNHPSVVFRKSVVIAAGGYRDMPLFEDWYLWLRMLSQGMRYTTTPSPLVYFRSNRDQLNRRRGLSYLKRELFFLQTARRERLIKNYQFLVRFGIACALRLLPEQMFGLIVKRFLRKKTL